MNWNNCGCSTIYTDAWGNVINGPNSGADGTVPAQPSCTTNWGLYALMGVAGVLGMLMAHGGKVK